MVEGFRETFVLDIPGGSTDRNATLEFKDGREEQWPGTDKRAMDHVRRPLPSGCL